MVLQGDLENCLFCSLVLLVVNGTTNNNSNGCQKGTDRSQLWRNQQASSEVIGKCPDGATLIPLANGKSGTSLFLILLRSPIWAPLQLSRERQPTRLQIIMDLKRHIFSPLPVVVNCPFVCPSVCDVDVPRSHSLEFFLEKNHINISLVSLLPAGKEAPICFRGSSKIWGGIGIFTRATLC